MPIPLHIVTGYLGAGKSTVLSHLLAEPTDERIVVLVNEVGELAIDHHLLRTLDDDAVLLPSGCVCCTIHGELFAAIEQAMTLAPDRLVLETTGIADPAPIVHGLAVHPRLAQEVSVAGVIAVVDVERGEMSLDEPEARAQVEVADRVILSKTDRAPGRAAALRARLAVCAPGASVRTSDRGRVERDWLLDPRPMDRVRTRSEARAWLHHGPHGADHGVERRTVALGPEVDVGALALWLSLVAQLDGDRLLRVKGIVRDRASGDWLVLQTVQQATFPPRRLPVAPTGWEGSAVVLIFRDAPPELAQRWVALTEQAARGEARRAP